MLGSFADFYSPLFSVVGPILSNQFRECNFPLIGIYINPIAAWITAFLPVVTEKVELYLDRHRDDSPAIHDMITSLTAFDKTLMQKFSYDGGDTSRPWRGVAGTVLVEWFDTWLEKEKVFALGRCDSILEERNNASIDYESFGPGKTKPTISATLVVDLLSNITKTYKKVPRVQYKLRFFIDVQFEVLKVYHQMLQDTLMGYKVNRTTVGRTINAVSKERQAALEGLAGLETLCKVFGSAEYIISALKDWMLEPVRLFPKLLKQTFIIVVHTCLPV